MSDAVSGFIGVLLGSGISIAKDVVAYWTGRKRRGRFAAVRIVCVLDQYVEKCVEVVGDDGTSYGAPAGRTVSGEDYYDPQADCPAPPSFPDDIDWTSIKPNLMYRILSLPNQAHETDRYISAQAEHACPPEYEEVFVARWEGYADLGLEALSIGDALRSAFNLPKISIAVGNADWDSGQYLRDKKCEMQKRKGNNQAVRAAMIARLESHAKGSE